MVEVNEVAKVVYFVLYYYVWYYQILTTMRDCWLRTEAQKDTTDCKSKPSNNHAQCLVTQLGICRKGGICSDITISCKQDKNNNSCAHSEESIFF